MLERPIHWKTGDSRSKLVKSCNSSKNSKTWHLTTRQCQKERTGRKRKFIWRMIHFWKNNQFIMWQTLFITDMMCKKIKEIWKTFQNRFRKFNAYNVTTFIVLFLSTFWDSTYCFGFPSFTLNYQEYTFKEHLHWKKYYDISQSYQLCTISSTDSDLMQRGEIKRLAH